MSYEFSLQMYVNVQNLVGNPFLLVSLLGLAEGLGYGQGYLFAEKCGRRWSQSGLLFLTTVLFCVVMNLSQYQTSTKWAGPAIAMLCMWIHMNVAGTFAIAYIQV